mgnify:CR=1 FL=1
MVEYYAIRKTAMGNYTLCIYDVKELHSAKLVVRKKALIDNEKYYNRNK